MFKDKITTKDTITIIIKHGGDEEPKEGTDKEADASK